MKAIRRKKQAASSVFACFDVSFHIVRRDPRMFIALFVSLCFIGVPGAPADDKATVPQTIHWKFTRQSRDDKWDGEIWYTGAKERVEMKFNQTTQYTIVANGKTYTWKVVKDQIVDPVVTEESRTLTSSAIRRVQSAQREGKRVGEETLEGVVCEKWAWVHPVYVHSMIWLPKERPGGLLLPKKQIDDAPGLQTGEHDIITETIRDVEIGKPMADELFVPPKDISFR